MNLIILIIGIVFSISMIAISIIGLKIATDAMCEDCPHKGKPNCSSYKDWSEFFNQE